MRAKNVLFEVTAGGGTLARPRNYVEPCECFPGKIWIDCKTNAKVGRQRHYLDPNTGVHYLDGKRIARAVAEKLDKNLILECSIDPRYVGADGTLRGVVSGREWCDDCEPEQKAKLSQSAYRYSIGSVSGRRRYRFTFDRFEPSAYHSLFYRLWKTTRPQTDREYTEYLIFCLLMFGRFSSVQDCSRAALAKRFRLPKSQISSIRRRYLQRLRRSAVPPEP